MTKPKTPKQLPLPTMRAAVGKPPAFHQSEQQKLHQVYAHYYDCECNCYPMEPCRHDDIEIIGWRTFVDAGYCTEEKHEGYSYFTFNDDGIKAAERFFDIDKY